MTAATVTVHEGATSSPAPGDLDLVRELMSLHEHVPGISDSLPPGTDTLRTWMVERDLLEGGRAGERDLRWALRVRTALLAKVRENMGSARDPEAAALLNRAAAESGLRMCFGCRDGGRIHAEAGGVRGAVGRLLGAAFLAELDGSWRQLRTCSDPACETVFFDRSRNHSTKWCSMETCGNRNKVRRFRARAQVREQARERSRSHASDPA